MTATGRGARYAILFAMTWDRGPRIVLLVAVVAGLAVGAWAIIVWLPARLVADAGLSGKDLLDAENDARGSLISAVGGLVLLGGLVFTARSYLATREGKVTDRYTAAVNQLGDSHLVVRLGGIYALERIARDSERDRRTIIDILAALVRETARPAGEPGPAPDVTAALEVLSRLPGVDVGLVIDLRGADLAELRLDRLHIPGADLTRASLKGGHLPGADLRNATLDFTDLTGATLSGATLAGARGTQAIFRNTTLDDADLRRGRFVGATFEAASMAGVDLREADLASTILDGATLVPSGDGGRAHVADTKFHDATFERTTVDGLDLSQAIGLTKAQRGAAKADAATRWPPGI